MTRFAALLLILLFVPALSRAQDVCGNNILESSEQCDDGNVLDGDGCSSTCTEEPATHRQLKSAMGNQELKDRVEVALVIVVDKIARSEDTDPGFDGANHANRVIWARRIMSDPEGAAKEAARFFPILIASNRTATLSQILGASDVAVQTAVEATVDLFADGN